jgi:hypothetical protein
MNVHSVAQWLAAMPLDERARALNRITYELTIRAREFGPDCTDRLLAARTLFGINEIQHKLASQTGRYLNGEAEEVYPVDVFCRILAELAQHHGIGDILTAAVEYRNAQARG